MDRYNKYRTKQYTNTHLHTHELGKSAMYQNMTALYRYHVFEKLKELSHFHPEENDYDHDKSKQSNKSNLSASLTDT